MLARVLPSAGPPMSAVILAALLPLASSEPNTFIPPSSRGGKPAALVWVQGAGIAAHLYTDLLTSIQNASVDLELWVGQPSFLLDTPEPLRLKANIEDTLALMYKAGMPADTPLLFGAHSLGTVFLQMYCGTAANNCTAQVLTGGPIARTSYYPKLSYPVPTLTLGGSLDGLARVTRTVAESVYQIQNVSNAGDLFPVAVIEGMNHYQWASGEPSLLEKSRDLHAEISIEQAHETAAALISDFFAQRLNVPGSGAKLAAAVSATKAFAAPLIEAYLLEGSRHFNAPRQIGGPGKKDCVKGGCPDHSEWARTAQAIVAGPLSGWNFNSSNNFVSCTSTPITGEVFHLPNISNDSATHTVFSTTYSQCKWDIADAEDTGFVYTSASEIGTKMSSRQCLLIKGVGELNTNFSVDDPDFCRMANEQAYAKALDLASPLAKTRYLAHGQPFTFGADIQKAGGPLFLDAGITYKDQGDAGVEISSPAQKTEIDYWKKHFGPIPRPAAVPDPGCFHYCKLLSPARAMEWIYVDGLRRHYGINSTAA